jgi:hypothetical protein
MQMSSVGLPNIYQYTSIPSSGKTDLTRKPFSVDNQGGKGRKGQDIRQF